MAANERDIKVGINFRDRVTGEYRKVKNTIGRNNKEIRQSMNMAQEASKKLSNSLRSVGAAVTGFFAFRKVNSLLRESIALFDTQAKAEAQLANALGYTSDKLIQQAKDLQKLTEYGDEATIRAQALIGAFVKEEDQILRVIPLVQDLAAAKGMDLAGAADLVSKTLGSSTNALSRYGIQVEGAVGSTERLESLTKGLDYAFGGTARTLAEVGAGPLKQFNNMIGDLKEDLGRAIIPAFIEAAKRVKTFIEDAGNAEKIKNVFAELGDIFMGIVENFKDIIDYGKTFFTVFAVSKITQIVVAFTSLNPVLFTLASALIAVEGATKFLDDLAKKKGGLAFLGNLEQVQNVKLLVMEMQRLQKDQIKVKNAMKEAAIGSQRMNILTKTDIDLQTKLIETKRRMEAITGEGFASEIKNLDLVIKGLNAQEKKLIDLENQKTKTQPDRKAIKPPPMAQAGADQAIDAARDLQEQLNLIALEGVAGREAAEIQELQNRIDQEMAILEKAGMDKVLLEATAEQRMTAIKNRYADEREKKAEEEKNQAKDLAREKAQLQRAEVNQFISNLQLMAGKNKEFGAIYKAAAITQTTIDTITGAQSAFKALAGIPVVGPVLGGAAAAAAYAAGFARVAQIKAQKFQGGGFVQQGPMTGDKVPVLANRGELILNAAQQRNILALANGGQKLGTSLNIGDIIINVGNSTDAEYTAGLIGDTIQERLDSFARTQAEVAALAL